MGALSKAADFLVYFFYFFFILATASMVNCWVFPLGGTTNRPNRLVRRLMMRDGSTAAVYFQLGDTVRVVTDVLHRPNHRPAFSSKNLVGTVAGLWEKCEVDPHCCCAEQAFDAPVEVLFENELYYGAENRRWTGHFATDELEKVREENRE